MQIQKKKRPESCVICHEGVCLLKRFNTEDARRKYLLRGDTLSGAVASVRIVQGARVSRLRSIQRGSTHVERRKRNRITVRRAST